MTEEQKPPVDPNEAPDVITTGSFATSRCFCGCFVSPIVINKALDEKRLPKPGQVFANQWRIQRLIDEGGYGCIYVAESVLNQQPAAVKVEKARATRPLLKMETLILKRLQGTKHAVKFLTCGVEPTTNVKYLVMELLGLNLSTLRRRTAYGRFEISTATRCAIQMLDALKDLHSIGFVHRDVKPSNFCIGLTYETFRTIFLIDFGLSRQYCMLDGAIRPARPVCRFRGTLRYCSPFVLMRQEQCRRDDVISLLYIVAEFLRGSLPWRRIIDRTIVMKVKTEMTSEELLTDLPEELFKFYKYVFGLRFDQRPNYFLLELFLRSILANIRATTDLAFEWENSFHFLDKFAMTINPSVIMPNSPMFNPAIRRPF